MARIAEIIPAWETVAGLHYPWEVNWDYNELGSHIKFYGAEYFTIVSDNGLKFNAAIRKLGRPDSNGVLYDEHSYYTYYIFVPQELKYVRSDDDYGMITYDYNGWIGGDSRYFTFQDSVDQLLAMAEWLELEFSPRHGFKHKLRKALRLAS